LVAAFLLTLAITSVARAADTVPVHKANYELAAKWTGQKVGKLVFDMAVTPHWLEFSDRFWYSYETRSGRQFYLVDPRAKTKKPLFDNAHMAAMLTRISLFPYDAQHLPIRTLKFMNKDTVIQFEIDYPKDAAVRDGEQVKTVQELGNDKKDQGENKQTDTKLKNDDMTDKSKGKGTDTGKETESKTKTLYFDYDLATQNLTLVPDFKAPLKKPDWASVSPDEKTVVFARGNNLFMMDAANYALAQKKADDKNVKETQVTTDGEEHDSYAETLKEERKKDFQKLEKDRKDYRVPPIRIVWSKDSKKFAVTRNDQRKVGDLWVINALSEPRPTLETYRYDMPGEENVTQDEILIFDVATRARVKVKADRFKDQSLGIESDRVLSIEREKDKVVSKWLSDTSDRLYFIRTSRDRHRADVCVANTETGDVKVLIEERLNTYIDLKPLRLVDNGKEILFWSERDGWGHYYLYDGNGVLKNQVTSGEFNCEGIAGIDAKGRVLYFTADGREPGEDPYFTHLYRVRFDGSGLKLLDSGDAMHAPEMNDAAQYVVDNSSRVDAAPVSALRDANGNVLTELETTDVSALTEAGFKYPEPFKVKADDGITDLYGVMYKPFDFDPTRRYPIIAYVYPGPQTEAVSKTFSPRNGNVALAQLGFIVIEVGNRGGSPQRSKWYHNFGYGNLRDYGLADKKRAIEELALKYPWIDLDRVGIYGHSGGGFMSTAAMLVYPDFFKVGFSESGNHENNIYNRWWSESHHGVKEVAEKDGNVKFEYSIEKNSELAANLKGHLMLTTGDIDDNVHPGNTMRLANALIRANKRFDLFIFPGQRHGYGDMSDYCFWLRADHFTRWLLGEAPTSVDMLELDREKPLVGGKSARTSPPEDPDLSGGGTDTDAGF
jgi:dipeptidyl aminopeptidase/acylaminoacyl peptidase